jgi:deoxyribodipyrimidine photo-lyase
LVRHRLPPLRLAIRSDASARSAGDFVLYWCIAARRPVSNFALDRAIEWAVELKKPLVVLEPLRVGYPWASDRLHRFVLQGMAANARAFAGKPVHYRPYVEPQPGAGRGLLEALAARACVVVTDDSPAFFLPRMVDVAARRLAAMNVRLEAVDGHGLVPLRAADAEFPSAYAFRRFLQKRIGDDLHAFPRVDPWKGLGKGVELPRLAALPPGIERRWPAPTAALFAGEAAALAKLPIDHAVGPAPFDGGCDAARAALAAFVEDRLPRYADERSDPDADASSGLSPWLHFGHLSIHELFAAVARREGWKLADLGRPNGGKKDGFWQMSASSEAFLDEAITWRELGANFCSKRPDFADWSSLPGWARATLEEHAGDPRPHVYTLDQFAAARTHDPLWNAAQRELVTTGRMHNYLRMLWGKKVLEWARSSQEALAILIELNNRYAVDGRDPNSYSGISWVFGRYDRPWAPKRPIFGSIRWMSSANTARKLRLKRYLARFSG